MRMCERWLGEVKGHMCYFLAAARRLAEIITPLARQINIKKLDRQ